MLEFALRAMVLAEARELPLSSSIATPSRPLAARANLRGALQLPCQSDSTSLVCAPPCWIPRSQSQQVSRITAEKVRARGGGRSASSHLAVFLKIKKFTAAAE